jgi:hypothetical protein
MSKPELEHDSARCIEGARGQVNAERLVAEAEAVRASAVPEVMAPDPAAAGKDFHRERRVVGRDEGLDVERQLHPFDTRRYRLQHEARVLPVRPDSRLLELRPAVPEKAIRPRSLAEDDRLSELHGAVDLVEQQAAQQKA